MEDDDHKWIFGDIMFFGSREVQDARPNVNDGGVHPDIFFLLVIVGIGRSGDITTFRAVHGGVDKVRTPAGQSGLH